VSVEEAKFVDFGRVELEGLLRGKEKLH